MQFAVVPYNLLHNMLDPKVILTLITSLFFHAGFAHISGNMLYLWVFGNNIEDRLGHIKFILFYLGCGIIASLGQVIVNPDSKLPMLGASGAVSAVLGAYLILYPRANVLVLIPLFYFWRIVKVQAGWFLLFWILLQFFSATASSLLTETVEQGGVAWIAHITGFFAGILFLKLLLPTRRRIILG
ncbi:MAG: rhomboid family intramembrane serine protease [Candidatus Omnitrophica bacterium]|nr:rhomboid family intramembrane serine protease [Candidatus Omnitrophota bacterium]